MQTKNNIKRVKPRWYDETQQIGAYYYEKKFEKTLEEWNHSINGETKTDISFIPNEILESWLRCQSIGVDPLATPQHYILSEQDLLARLKKNKDLIEASQLFMNHLYHFVKSSRFNVSLFDKDGFILDVMQDKQHYEEARAHSWVVGSQWSENIAGNNAIGTSLFYKKPIRIFGPQHFCRVFHKRSVSSAPIFNPEGELIGGIMMLGIYYGAHPYTLGMVVAAAQSIENELRTQKKLSAVNKTSNDQKTVISSIPDAIITIDNQGYISFMNDHAKEMLHTVAHRAEGKRFKDILGDLNHRFFEIIENNETVTDREVRIFYRNASSDYTLTTNLIISQDGGITGKILFLNEIKRAKSLVATMIGAKAKFHFEDIYGQHPKFLKTIEQARMISQSSSNVLLLGKSGTGKDIFAQAIHNAGDHRDGPYVAINCAAIPRDLISSELFGYSEGAFTGSRKGGNQGKFELADGGTIFLDEIAEIPLELQTVLLRVIEEKTVTRIGGTSVRPINVRIIAATNKDLKEEIKKGAFREDLYYRLNVFSIHLMPLSDRLDDILLLVNHFVRKHEKTMRKRIDRIDNDVISIFMNYSWPGNVRELQNIIERMMSMANGNELTVDLIPQEINDFKNYTKTIESIESPEEKERKMIETMIKMKFQKKAIAKKLNISRMTLYRKIEKYSRT